MHIADGVLDNALVGAAAAAGTGLLWHSVRGMQAEEVPKVGLLAAAFFVSSLLRIPVGLTSVHPVLLGLTGILLGKRAPLALFIGLVLQAFLFQHGGLTTLGVNLLIMGIPALLTGYLFNSLRSLSPTVGGALAGALSVITAVAVLALFLAGSATQYYAGTFSLVNIIIMAHIPIVFIEALLTASAVRLVQRVRPELLTQRGRLNG